MNDAELLWNAFKILGCSPRRALRYEFMEGWYYRWEVVARRVIEVYWDKFERNERDYKWTMKLDGLTVIVGSQAEFEAFGISMRTGYGQFDELLRRRIEMFQIEKPDKPEQLPSPKPDKEVEMFLQMLQKIKHLQRENAYLYERLAGK